MIKLSSNAKLGCSDWLKLILRLASAYIIKMGLPEIDAVGM